MKLNTREGREQEVLDYVRKHKGFSIFWVTGNQMRACAAVRLEKAGRIKTSRKREFPWCPCKAVKP